MSEIELFPTNELLTESPRLIWVRRHGLRTRKLPSGLWVAWRAIDVARGEQALGRYVSPVGSTEEEALIELAKDAGLKLWNEEGAP